MLRYENYKPSGTPWLGDVPSHWSIQPLIAVATKKSICNCPEKELLSVYLDKGVIKFTDVDEKRTNATSEDLSKYQEVLPGDFVLNNQQAWRGSVGVSEHEGIVSPAYIVLRLTKNLNPRFANYLFRDGSMVSQYLVCSKGVGTIQRNLYWPQLKRSRVAIPPLEEQTCIVAFLDQKTAEIDAAIAKKERLIELLQEQKNIRIHQAVLRGLNPEVPLCDSGVTWIGAVPAHWKVIPNRYIFREQNARSLRGEETHLSMSQRYGLVPAKELDVQTLQSESYDGAKLCQKGDLVQNRLKAHLAVFAVAPCDGLVSPDYSVFRLQNSENQPVYFERLFKTPNYLGEFNRRVRGIVVGFLRLYSEDFNAIPALVPPCDEQVEIVRFIETTNKEFEDIRAKIDAEIVMLRELKAITVASAVTGKIKV
jgi:type I restriction enzyme S subunit